VRFFSLNKDGGYFLGNLGVAFSVATSKIWSIASAIGCGISVFGNTLNFAAELERQFGANGITVEDYRDAPLWAPCLKKVECLNQVFDKVLLLAL